MRKCKICGELFQYHVSNSHLELHGITREEYNEIKGKEAMFSCSTIPKKAIERDIDNYIIESFRKTKKKYNIK